MSCSSHSPPASQTRAVQRVVAQQQLQRVALRAWTISGVSVKKTLALGDLRSAGGLQLGHLILADDAHAAGGLRAETGVVAEGRNLNARALADLNQQRARGCGDLVAVYGDGDIWHSKVPVLLRSILVRVLKQNLLVGAVVMRS